MGIQTSLFGKLPDGTQATLYTLTNSRGAQIALSNYGGLLTAIVVPGRGGELENVTLGCDGVAGYLPNVPYLGGMIGRVGNRIAQGEAQIAGRVVQLAKNANGHHLHGGMRGFDQRLWQAQPHEGQDTQRVRLTYRSPDGEEHYPGTLQVAVTYSWNDACECAIQYEATCDQDTLVNLTHHAYFNLEGQDHGDIQDHIVYINADAITAIDAACIPTGALMPVEATPFDFRSGVRLGDALAQEAKDSQLKNGGGFDHNFVLNNQNRFRQVARVVAPACGRVLEVLTDQPGMQFYTGNFLDGSMISPTGKPYRKRAGFCMETQAYPDAVHHAAFPSILLPAGERYIHHTVYRFSVV